MRWQEVSRRRAPGGREAALRPRGTGLPLLAVRWLVRRVAAWVLLRLRWGRRMRCGVVVTVVGPMLGCRVALLARKGAW